VKPADAFSLPPKIGFGTVLRDAAFRQNYPSFLEDPKGRIGHTQLHLLPSTVGSCFCNKAAYDPFRKKEFSCYCALRVWYFSSRRADWAVTVGKRQPANPPVMPPAKSCAIRDT
jgi:hypothetical protein